MNFGKSITYIFEDSEWFNKLWKPVLCGLIPIIGQFVLQGYMMSVTKNVAQGEERPLPEMNFNENLNDGFRMFLVQLVYSLPILLLWGIFYAIAVPVLMQAIKSGAGIEAGKAIGGVFFQVITSILSMVISVVYCFIFPVITANVAVKGTFKAGFAFKELFEMVKRNLSAWLMVLGGALLASFIAPIGAIVFLIGVIVSGAYARLLVAHLQGQAYRESNLVIPEQEPYYPQY